MDKKIFKERVERLEEVSAVLTKLPSEIRAAAFPLLEAYITGSSHTPGTAKPSGKKEEQATPVDFSSAEDFFAAHEHGKPADNVKLIAAYLYNEYGSESFSIDEVRAIARDVGVTIPNRIDATFDAAASGGKKLFVSAGKGKRKPTVNGEAYLKTTYNVKKGTKRRQVSAE